MNWSAVSLSIQVTAVATVFLFLIGLAFALLLARTHFPGKTIVETLINLPLVLPPTVVGYYLLVVLGRGGPLVEWFNINIIFTWQAAAVASAIVGLPLMVQTSKSAVLDIDPNLENAARTMGSNEWQVLRYVTLPLARRGIATGLILGSARALGEFGATLMVAGNIPGKTQTLPMAIYDAVLNGQYASANKMVLVMTVLSFAGLWWVNRAFKIKTKSVRHGN